MAVRCGYDRQRGNGILVRVGYSLSVALLTYTTAILWVRSFEEQIGRQ